jgi:uncharacterized repeat protein (TIGR03803 family)
VFKFTPVGVLSTLHTFKGGVDGQYPQMGNLVQGSDGCFYGTTAGGDHNNAGSLKVLPIFKGGIDGGWPLSGLVQGGNGNFYGTTGGISGDDKGTIFEMTPSGVLTTLHAFNGKSDGAQPMGSLFFSNDGSFYGTAYEGGAFDEGTIFKWTPPASH